MPTMRLKQISKTQPMREGEIAVVDYLNGDLTKYLEQETSERIAGINEFKGKVEAERARAEAAEGKLTADLADEVNSRKTDSERLTTELADERTARESADTRLTTELADERTARESADTKLTSDLASEVTERKAQAKALDGRFPVKAEDIKDGAVGPTKLDATILTQLGRLDTLPVMEYGLTPSFSVEANSHADVTITYASPKATVPILICSVVCQTNVLACTLAQVSTTQAVVRVDNMTTTKIDNVSISWSLISRG
jgi:hypothetical protein